MEGSLLEETYELIKSLTKSEKRYFKLYCKFQQGNKSYLYLFDILEKQNTFNPFHPADTITDIIVLPKDAV